VMSTSARIIAVLFQG